jgi:hypothetical protein
VALSSYAYKYQRMGHQNRERLRVEKQRDFLERREKSKHRERKERNRGENKRGSCFFLVENKDVGDGLQKKREAIKGERGGRIV